MRFDVATQTVHAAGREWMADPTCTNIDDQAFSHSSMIHRDRRCMVRFESGWSASIIWGSGTYSSNHDAWNFDFGDPVPFVEEPATVEVGVLDHTGELRQRIDEDGDCVGPEGYLDDEALAVLLDLLATLPSDFDYGVAPPSFDEVKAALEQFNEQFGPGSGPGAE